MLPECPSLRHPEAGCQRALGPCPPAICAGGAASWICPLHNPSTWVKQVDTAPLVNEPSKPMCGILAHRPRTAAAICARC
jgi:hypothetical protein